MSPEQRREMIIKAALPLVTAHGGAVTTQLVARAAGIGEATIFRVFADKEALLDAVMAEALRPDTVLAELATISLDQPLAERLIEAGDALQAHMDRLGAVVAALMASGHARRSAEPRPAGQGGAGCRPDTSMAEQHEALVELFAPEADSLRMPPDRLAGMFLGLLFTRQRPAVAETLGTHELVDLFLHGALTATGGTR
jgi:AcrR family transcriptional regulator